MSERPLGDELERALNRPDAEELRRVLVEYFDWHQVFQRDPDEARQRDDLGIDWRIHDYSDPDRSLALVALTIEKFDDPMFLGLVAAGPLEDILMFAPDGSGEASPSDEVFGRVMQEARKTPRFRWMLGGIYTSHLRQDQQEVFDRVVGKIDWEALPPRPRA